MTRSDTVVLREVVLELLPISFCNISPDKVTWRNEYTFQQYSNGASARASVQLLYLRENGKLFIRENLVMTSTYVRTDFPGRGKQKRIPPLSAREFCPLLFQKVLEMIGKSESIY